MQDNIALKGPLPAPPPWMTIEKGDVASGDVWLKRQASRQGDNEVHHLSVDNLTAHLPGGGCAGLYIPDTRIVLSMINLVGAEPGAA